MQRLQDRLSNDNFTVIYISTENSRSKTENFMKKYLNNKKPSFPVLLGGNKIKKQLKGKGSPNTFIIDSQGIVRYMHVGFEKGLEKYIETEVKILLKIL